jgi:hypothetical protein
MNKHSFFCIIFLASLLAGSAIAYSQINSSLTISPDAIRKAGEALPGAVAPNEKAENMFKKMFGNAANVSWAPEDKGQSLVYFETPGKKNRAGFDKKGNLVYTISNYREEQLPQDILLKVKESYFGRSIFCVTEVNYDGKTAYLIVLEDKTTWLHIKIVGDEMIEEKLFTKG